MVELSNKVTGDELLAVEWSNHSKEKENVVTSTGRGLNNTETQLAESVDEYAKSNWYEAVATTPNNYVVSGRTITIDCALKDKMIINIKVNIANTGICTLDFMGNGAKEFKNADGTQLDAGMLKLNQTVTVLYFANIFYLTTLTSAKNLGSEMDKLITNAGLTIDSSDDEQITKAIDIFGKSNYYDTALAGSTYTGTRGLLINVLQAGMILFVKFNSNNNGSVTLNLGNGVKNIVNSNGNVLRKNMIMAGDVIPFIYDGTKYISIRKLFMKFNNDNNVSYMNTGITISNYFAWDSSLGANPVFGNWYLNASLSNNIMHVSASFDITHDGFDSETGKNLNPCRFDITKFLKDLSGFDCTVLAKTTTNSQITPVDAGNASVYNTLVTTIFPPGNGAYSNQIAFLLGSSPFYGKNKTYTKWIMYMNAKYMVNNY